MKRIAILALAFFVAKGYAQTDLRSDYQFISSTEKGAIPHELKINLEHTKGVVGGWLELERNCFIDCPVPLKQYNVRRARLYLDLIHRKFLEFMIMGQMRRNRCNYHYLYFDTLKPDYFRVRVGLFKKPFSLEALYSTRYFWMINRSLGALNYQRLLDIGVEAHGNFWKERIEWGAGLFNGNRRNLKNNPHKNFCARVAYRPYAENKASRFHRLRFGISFETCQKRFSLPTLRTGSETPFLKWNGPVKAKTSRLLFGGDAEWLVGPFAIRGEFLLVNWNRVSNQSKSVPFTGYSWYIGGGYMLTGEEQKHNLPLFPRKNFNICEGGGAIEVTARYEAFQADHKVVKAQLATGTTYVSGFTLGTNYFFNPFVLMRMNWQKNYFHKRIVVKNRHVRGESVVTFILQGEF